jgi:hypothetical protein
MMQTRTQVAQAQERTISVERRQPRLVLWWAGLGVTFLGFQTYLYLAWVVSGNAKRTPNGADPVWPWTKVVVHSYEAASCIAFIAVIYLVLIRPWWRDRQISFDGMLCIAFLSIYWQDVLFNYSGASGTYNTEFFNLGSWLGNVPGVVQPNAERFAEPLLFSPLFYVYGFLGFVVAGCATLRWARRRWPRTSNLGLVAMVLLLFAAFDLILEIPILGMMNIEWYPGAPSWATLFHGQRWQLPYHEVALVAIIFTTWTYIRFCRDDKGYSIAEKGIERVPTSDGRRLTIRVLALIGIFNLSYLFLYMLPWNLMGPRQSAWPNVFLEHSWMRDGLCGEGTTYACPGPAIPNARPDSPHLAPDGTLVVP